MSEIRLQCQPLELRKLMLCRRLTQSRFEKSFRAGWIGRAANCPQEKVVKEITDTEKPITRLK